MIVCVLIPRFSLLAAAGDRRELLLRPTAVAPAPGGMQVVGEVSGPAEAFGVRSGMRLGEALARCPELALAPPDAERTESAWESLLRRLEGIGAAVEPGRPGEAFFEADGLRGLWGGRLDDVLRRARRALRAPARIGAGAARFPAHAAATRARVRAGGALKGVTVVPAGATRAFLAPLPVELLDGHLEAGAGAEHVAGVIRELTRLGIRTLGELGALPRDALADRFGAIGLRARELAGGEDRPLRPRRAPEDLFDAIELPEAISGMQLERALSLLIGRLLAHPLRRGRSFRRLRLTARLAAGGGWRSDATLRVASAEPDRLRLSLLPKLAELPGPVARLGLRGMAFAPPGQDQPSLSRDPGERRRERLAEAVRQARAAGGRDAILRVLDVDPESRVPERRLMLTPFPE